MGKALKIILIAAIVLILIGFGIIEISAQSSNDQRITKLQSDLLAYDQKIQDLNSQRLALLAARDQLNKQLLTGYLNSTQGVPIAQANQSSQASQDLLALQAQQAAAAAEQARIQAELQAKLLAQQQQQAPTITTRAS